MNTLSVFNYLIKPENGREDRIIVDGSSLQPGNSSICDCRCHFEFALEFRQPNYGIWCSVRAGKGTLHVLFQTEYELDQDETVFDRSWVAMGLLEADGIISLAPELGSVEAAEMMHDFSWSSVRVQDLQAHGTDRNKCLSDQGGGIWRARYQITLFGLAMLLHLSAIKRRMFRPAATALRPSEND